MKLGVALAVVFLGGFVSLAGVAQGCGGTEDTVASGAGKTVPAEEGPPTASSDERTFALDTISLGDADRSGTANKDAWKTYGFDLDGRTTNVTDGNSPALAQVCKRVAGASPTVHQDGERGTDNTFGSKVLKLLQSVITTPSKTITDAVRRGDFTILVNVKGLTDDPLQTNTGLTGNLLIGGAYGSVPAFDTTTDWPYVADPRVPIAGAYITKGVFVNGKGGASVRLSLLVGGQALTITIQRALVSFKHNPATKSLEDGTIAGVVDSAELVSGIGEVAGRFDPSLCAGTIVEGIKTSIRQSSDMIADGTQDPSRECNGISIGIGFSAKQVANPTKVAAPSVPAPDPCTGDAGAPVDAGTDAGDGG